MSEYRNIGILSRNGNGTPLQIAVNTVQRGQVYQATHEGDSVLPFMKRSFISFTFGGKTIESFNLIATTKNNSLDKAGYAPINDIVTTYDNLNGQQYWNTHYGANSISFILATDGIDQKMLNDFLFWFQAGVTRELILAEHPTRAILARVAEAPHLDLLPFESEIQVKINNVNYSTKTTLYKGEIELKLVMDQPFWYSTMNIVGKIVSSGGKTYYNDVWDDVTTGTTVSVFNSQDALKVVYEDGIPIGSMIQSNMMLGNSAYASISTRIESRIWNPTTEEGARIEGEKDGVTYAGVGIIDGPIVDASGNGISSLANGSSAYFFYSGTAPAPTKISFTLTPSRSNDNNQMTIPRNSITSPNSPYSKITITCQDSQELRFTTPNLYTSFNKAIYIFRTSHNKMDCNDLRSLIRDEVRHPAVRNWAIKIISGMTGTFLASTTLYDNMWQFLQDDNDEITPATFTFNSETGEAIGEFEYKNTDNTLETHIEDVGDMLRSNQIFIRERNIFNANGYVTNWTENNPKLSHKITNDVGAPISNLSIKYKNMYL